MKISHFQRKNHKEAVFSIRHNPLSRIPAGDEPLNEEVYEFCYSEKSEPLGCIEKQENRNQYKNRTKQNIFVFQFFSDRLRIFQRSYILELAGLWARPSMYMDDWKDI